MEFLVISPQSNSQQLKDYFTYYISDTSAKRQNIFNGNDIDSENDDNFLKLESDGDNLYYINNFAGNIKFTSLYIDTNLHEKPYSDIKESQILFCKYNINSHSLNVKKFGSNYFNKVWLTKIDEKKRNICTIISTCDDTVRLDPSNQNDFISFIDRKERLWMLVINTEGKLISKLLIAEYNLPSNIRTYDHHKIAVLSKFENNDNIIFPFKSQNALRILPDYEADSFNLKNGVRYILCFNIKTNKLKWVKKLIATNQIFVSNNINNIKMTVCVQLSKKDSLLIYSDFNNKNTISYNFNYENLFDDEMITYIFKFDTFGNITPLFNVTSKKIYEPEDRTIIENIIENNSKLLVLLSSNNDSIKIFNKYIIGKPDPLFPYTKSKKKIFFFEIDINNQKTNNLLNNINDSIIPLNLIKTINGFYTLFRYSNTAVNFNLNKTDTIINFKDDDYFKYPENLTFHTICKYDTNYEIKWLNKGFVKNIFDINNKNIIINYFLKYPRSFDIDFRPEQIGQIKPVPIMMMEAIYNCKPISYYKSEDIGKNTVKFTNLGEYNCS
ncbi:MAG: hypothetical protein HUU47_09140, partial [Bacteroidetes bacterium]|nr:hypothetical protein [Bacteroidota bacterium]